MTFEQLRVLQAIVTTGTFRAAARSLHKSQPAISTAIKNLEAELGIKIFNRESYRPTLTAPGRGFYEKSLTTVDHMTRLGNFARRVANHEEATLTLAINAVNQLSGILEKLRQIEERHPATEIRLNIEQMGGPVERLLEDEADLIISTHTDVNLDFMEAVPFAEVAIIPVSHKDFPLAKVSKMLSSDDVRPFAQVIVGDSSRERAKQSLDVISDSRRWIVTDFATKKDIIMAGMGWGGMPEHLIAGELAGGVLKRLYVDQFDIRQSQQYLIRRTDRSTGVVAQTIWETLSATDQPVRE